MDVLVLEEVKDVHVVFSCMQVFHLPKKIVGKWVKREREREREDKWIGQAGKETSSLRHDHLGAVGAASNRKRNATSGSFGVGEGAVQRFLAHLEPHRQGQPGPSPEREATARVRAELDRGPWIVDILLIGDLWELLAGAHDYLAAVSKRWKV